MKKTIITLLLIVSMAGCSSASLASDTFVFTYNQHQVSVGDDASSFIKNLGSYTSLSTAPSCAFDGEDTIYDYPGIQLSTYQDNGVEVLTGVYLLDSSVSTSEGIKIGSTKEEVLDSYGNEFTEEYGVITYTKEKTELSFVISDEVVTSISYIHIVE